MRGQSLDTIHRTARLPARSTRTTWTMSSRARESQGSGVFHLYQTLVHLYPNSWYQTLLTHTCYALSLIVFTEPTKLTERFSRQRQLVVLLQYMAERMSYPPPPPPHPAKFSLFSHNFTSMMNPFNLQLGIALTIVIGVIWGLGWGLSSLLEELKSSSHRRGQGR